MTNCEHFRFPSADGKTAIHAVLWTPADRTPAAVLQIVHGVAEHIERYADFASYLCDRGIAVAGEDHLGHGRTLTDGAVPVYLGESDGWAHAVEDIHTLHGILSDRFPHTPQLLLGHSMGSFLSRTYLIRYPGRKKAAVLMGTGWQPGYMLTGGLLVANHFIRKNGSASTSDFVTKLAFGGYNKPFAPTRTNFDWLSADEGNVDRYIDDPLCGMDATVGLFRDMLGGIRFNQKKENLQRMNMDTPILFISGAEDPVGDRSRGVQKSFDAFRGIGVKDVSLKFYSGLRHEILNESSMQQTVYADVENWLRRYI